MSIPEILKNPSNPIFNLEEAEIYSIKEFKELLELEKYSYALFALWNSVIINIQRRIELFGVKNLLSILEKDEIFNESASSLKERWLNINEFDLINYALKLSIINHTTHDLLAALFWMKTDIEEYKNKIELEEIYSLLLLIEKNLFLKEFKKDKRTEVSKSPLKRRESDKEEEEEFITKLSNTTHNELLLKAKINPFSSSESMDKNSLISRYI